MPTPCLPNAADVSSVEQRITLTDQTPTQTPRPAPIRLPMLGDGGSCCPPPPEPAAFTYRDWPCIYGWLDTPAGPVAQVSTRLARSDRFGRWQMRWGIGRDRYRVRPGLYAVGTPDATAPVLASANYKLSFDVLRSCLAGRDAWMLVLDTRGINVWCAAGKGTFGTAELLRQVAASRLAAVVSHRTLIVPQLGAVGVAAHEIAKGCGFRVVYGPVRAADLPAFLDAGLQASAAMRRVTFSAWERLILTPVELTAFGRKPLWIALALLLLGGVGPQIFSLSAAINRGGAACAALLVGLLSGTVLAPLLLPWLPGRAFAAKGWLLGLALAAGCAVLLKPAPLQTLPLLLALPALSSYCAMNFTGSSTFTSPSGVEKEMRRYLPLQGAALLLAGIAWLAGAFVQ
jgi:hypothetical protein